MKVADNTNDQACSRRILSDFGRHNKHSKSFIQSRVFRHDVSCLTFSPVCLLHRLSQGFARSTEQVRSARAGDKREARERDDGNKHTARGRSDGKLNWRREKGEFFSRFFFSPLLITPFVPAFLNN